jgi:hypothetical protein
MSNVLDLLLNADVNLIKKPTKLKEIKRLSDLFGKKIEFECQALSYNQMLDVKECVNEKIPGEYQIYIVMEGVKTPSLKNKDLLAKFNAITPKELLLNGNFLLSGEILDLYTTITELSGFGDDSVEEKTIEEIKN